MKNETLKVKVAMCVRTLEYLGLNDFSGHISTKSHVYSNHEG